ncbi:unnamed protein product [Lactuca virosa]|uniref:Uncharacterized protein n=1 Tax=Lactuca virosa TaxID=75947 RepID=A0AAU9NKX8_9ASTR|nr:unnamed protein product [Lactuca virosa]
MSLDHDIPDLSGELDNEVCFDNKVNEDNLDVNCDKEEGEMGCFSSGKNYNDQGERGVGFLDRKRRFFNTSGVKKKGCFFIMSLMCLPRKNLTRSLNIKGMLKRL